MHREDQKIEIRDAGSDAEVLHDGQNTLPAVTNNQAAAKAELHAAAQKSQPLYNKKAALPFGNIAFTLILIVLALGLETHMQVMRTSFLSNLVQNERAQDPVTYLPKFVDCRLVYATALAQAGDYKASAAVLQALEDECVKLYGNEDQVVAYVRLVQAERALAFNDFSNAKKLWMSTLKVMEEAKSVRVNAFTQLKTTPFDSASIYYRLAKACEQRDDYKDAAILYKAALNLWDYASPCNTKTNCWAELAEVYSKSEDYKNALKYMTMAYDKYASQGPTGYNVYRTTRISQFYVELKQIDKAKEFAEKSYSLATQCLSPDNFYHKEAVKQKIIVERMSNLGHEAVQQGAKK